MGIPSRRNNYVHTTGRAHMENMIASTRGSMKNKKRISIIRQLTNHKMTKSMCLQQFSSSPSSWILKFVALNHTISSRDMFSSIPTIFVNALVQIIHSLEEEPFTYRDEYGSTYFYIILENLLQIKFLEIIHRFKYITQLRENLLQLKFLLMKILLMSLQLPHFIESHMVLQIWDQAIN